MRTRTIVHRLWQCMLSVCLIVACLAASSAQAQLTTRQIDAIVRPAMEQWGQVGLAMAIVDGDTDSVRVYGVRDIDSGAPVTPDTLFGIGSCSKAFAAATVAKLVDDARLSWDDRVDAHLPWFRTNDAAITHDLRVRDLLTDRSGLHATIPRSAALDRATYLRSIALSEPWHSLRSEFSYTNDMFTLAGELVAQVSGRSWESYARANVWSPLGMERTNADHRAARRETDHAAPHVTVEGRAVAVPWVYEDFTAAPSGGVNSSARDLSRWLHFQLSDGTVAGRSILSAQALAETHLPHTPLRGERTGPFRVFSDVVGHGVDGIRFESYAMGWMTQDYRGRTLLYHGGTITGFRCMIGFLPEVRFGAAILINQDNTMLPNALFLQLVDRRLGRADRNWPAVFHARMAQRRAEESARVRGIDAARIANSASSRPLEAYTGEYRDATGVEWATVRLVDGKLHLELQRADFELAHWHYDVFRLLPSTLRLDDGVVPWPYPEDLQQREFVSFQLDERGVVRELSSEMGRYRRAPEAR